MGSITGLSAEKEQQYQERLLIKLSKRYAPYYAIEIRRAMRDYAKAFGSVGLQAEVMVNHGQRLNKILRREYNAAFKLFGGRMIDSINKSYKKIELKREVPVTEAFERAQQAWIAINASAKVTQIVGTTQKQAEGIINDSLEMAISQGLGEKETGRLVRKNIREVGGQLSIFRSRMISRTEGHAASQASQDGVARASELPMTKTWAASGGERTRDTHNEANGQTVNMNDSFKVGDDLLKHPGDPRGSAEEVINCRCVAIYGVR